jgi:hypothetical protein
MLRRTREVIQSLISMGAIVLVNARRIRLEADEVTILVETEFVKT